MPIIRNVTQKEQVISGKVVQPYKTIEVSSSELLNLHSMINHKMIVVEEFTLTPQNEVLKNIEKNELMEDKIKTNKIDFTKDDMIESFFALYLDKKLSEDNIKSLKLFYQQIGPTSIISKETKDLLNRATNEEELIEVLLNHIYPELIELFIKNCNI